MKLKTLKDVAQCTRPDGKDCEGWIPDIQELREEAIKWIKELPKDAHDTVYTIDWIKHFFNITKEDLKDSEGKA